MSFSLRSSSFPLRDPTRGAIFTPASCRLSGFIICRVSVASTNPISRVAERSSWLERRVMRSCEKADFARRAVSDAHTTAKRAHAASAERVTRLSAIRSVTSTMPWVTTVTVKLELKHVPSGQSQLLATPDAARAERVSFPAAVADLLSGPYSHERRQTTSTPTSRSSLPRTSGAPSSSRQRPVSCSFVVVLRLADSSCGLPGRRPRFQRLSRLVHARQAVRKQSLTSTHERP